MYKSPSTAPNPSSWSVTSPSLKVRRRLRRPYRLPSLPVFSNQSGCTDSGRHSAINMKHTSTVLRDEARHVLLLKIDNLSVTTATVGNHTDRIKTKSRCSVGGYDWEILLYHSRFRSSDMCWVGLELVLVGEEARGHSVTATLLGRLAEYQHSGVRPLEFQPTVSGSQTFRGPSVFGILLDIASGTTRAVPHAGSLTVECTIIVLRDTKAAARRLPSSDLHRHLGKLLDNPAGADVTFTVSGESFAAHKNILAARSPVFMAEFFGAMVERTSQCVEIRDMDPAVFKAMLRFVYTDMVPELDAQTDVAAETVMAQHLLVAADRYGLDSLKAICEQRLMLTIDIKTAASTLALAEQHNCSGLKAECIEFIAGGSPENLDAVMATEGYRHLEASNPSVLSELLRAAKGRKR